MMSAHDVQVSLVSSLNSCSLIAKKVPIWIFISLSESWGTNRHPERRKGGGGYGRDLAGTKKRKLLQACKQWLQFYHNWTTTTRMPKIGTKGFSLLFRSWKELNRGPVMCVKSRPSHLKRPSTGWTTLTPAWRLTGNLERSSRLSHPRWPKPVRAALIRTQFSRWESLGVWLWVLWRQPQTVACCLAEPMMPPLCRQYTGAPCQQQGHCSGLMNRGGWRPYLSIFTQVCRKV